MDGGWYCNLTAGDHKCRGQGPDFSFHAWSIELLISSAFRYLFAKEFKNIYGVKETKFKMILLNFNLKLLKYTRPFLPPFFRLIAPARWAKQRIVKNPNLKFKDKADF